MATSTDEIAALKQRHHATWAAGDYGSIARLIEDVAAYCADRLEIEHGEELLDIATGTGNLAIEAAKRGAMATGLDLTPELLDVARRRAAEEDLDIVWVAGDAEALPFADGSFDCATSAFGLMFAPRHALAARELTRVLRPAGRFLLTTWAPDGMAARLSGVTADYLPPLPSGTQSPMLWGEEAHVRAVFDGLPVELEFDRRTVSQPFESPESYIAFFEEHFGPTIMARKAAETQGRWGELRELMIEVVSRHYSDGAVHQDYYVIEGLVAAG
jgi:SAM-dependent methyltransferase